MDRPRPNASDGTAFGYLFQRECKHSEKRSITVKGEWLEKLDAEALAKGRLPLLVIGLSGLRPGVDGQWACVPLALFGQILEAWKQLPQSRPAPEKSKPVLDNPSR